MQSKTTHREVVETRRWNAVYSLLFIGFTVQAVYLMASMPVPNDRILIEVEEGNEILKSIAETSKKLDVKVERIESRLEQTLPPSFIDALHQKLSTAP